MKKPVTIRARVQQVFIVDGLRPIKERTATILVAGKMTWAEIYDRQGVPRRRRLGNKAFFTLKDAERRKLSELAQMAKLVGIPVCEHLGYEARTQLKKYHETGAFH